MPTQGIVAAFAIEDRVDFWFEDGPDAYRFSETIPEEPFYFESVRTLIAKSLRLLIEYHYPGAARDIFNSVDTLVISVPGVVVDNFKVVQLPLWNQDAGAQEEFDFRIELSQIIDQLIYDDRDTWGKRERDLFMQRIFVVNDATACAAFEYGKRYQQGNVEDFIYLKIHNGINIGFVESRDNGRFEIRTLHAEAGHYFPVPHVLDAESAFEGVCPFHGSCVEGMIASNGLLKRAIQNPSNIFPAWQKEFQKTDPAKPGSKAPKQEIERNYIHNILQTKEAVDLVSHYVAQLTHALSIIVFPSKIVVGGRMAKPAVIDGIAQKIVAWANGYPKRVEMTPEGIKKYIVPSKATDAEKEEIELLGALAIARARADLPMTWAGNSVPLSLGNASIPLSNPQTQDDDINEKSRPKPTNVIYLIDLNKNHKAKI